MPPIELRTPTAFLFFGLAAVVLYQTDSLAALKWYGYAGFCFFAALGPLGWIAGSIEGDRKDKGNGFTWVGDLLDTEERRAKVRFFLWTAQMLLLGLGVGLVGVTWF